MLRTVLIASPIGIGLSGMIFFAKIARKPESNAQITVIFIPSFKLNFFIPSYGDSL